VLTSRSSEGTEHSCRPLVEPAVALLEDKIAIVTGGAVADWFIRTPVSGFRWDHNPHCGPTGTAGQQTVSVGDSATVVIADIDAEGNTMSTCPAVGKTDGAQPRFLSSFDRSCRAMTSSSSSESGPVK